MGDLLLHIIYLCTIGLSLYTSSWLLLKADRNDTTGALAACQILVMIWCIPQLFAGAVTTVGMKYLAYGISYVGICFIGPAWLEFSFRYCKKRYGRRMRIVLFGISAVNFSMFLCNDSYHLFYRYFWVEQVVYGPVFYFHMLYTYCCVFCGMFVVLKEFIRKRVAPLPLVLILLTAAVPLSFNLLYISGMVKSSFDLTPPAFALSSLLMLLAVFRYDFLDVKAMTFGQIFSSIGEGVVVYNQRGRLTYCNRAAVKWLGISQGQEFDLLKKRLEEIGAAVNMEAEPECGENSEQVNREREQVSREGGRSGQEGGRLGRKGGKSGQDGGTASREREMVSQGREFPAVTLADGARLRICQYVHRSRRGQMIAGTFVITDVSEYYELLRQSRELEEFRGNLALEQERNRIAQEVHDTTGHTLTMIQSLLRLMRTEAAGTAEEKAAQLSYLDQAQELVTGGIRELRCAINQMRQERGGMSVTQEIRQLADSVRGLEIEVEVQGEDGEAYMALSPIVYSCFREAITNCLKYAQASHMDVIVKLEEERLCLYIFDDGQGCAEVQENNGIRGIRERVRLAGGTVRIMTAEGEGFQIYLELPVKREQNNHVEVTGDDKGNHSG